MIFYPHSFSDPAENLACDEALLDLCEESDAPGFLRFWESPSYFVVLGYAKKLAEEVWEEKCRAASVPIFRRASGGGTVLQGPGCMNYCVVLPLDLLPEPRGISTANCWIMKRIRESVQEVCDRPVEIQGYTDLTVDNRKFSGNAQRRRRRALIFHGSFLLRFDLARVPELLRPPADQPAYRQKREHIDFLTNLPMRAPLGDNTPAALIENHLRRSWQAERTLPPELAAEALHRVDQLVRNRYATEQWNRRF
jgi:lipoate-protein ligase A